MTHYPNEKVRDLITHFDPWWLERYVPFSTPGGAIA